MIKYTVELNNLEKGTITFIEDTVVIHVGDYVENVQFIDKFNNNMGKNGTIIRIINTEVL